MRARLRDSEEHRSPKRRGRPQKKVRYQLAEGAEKKVQQTVPKRKEDIRIPSPPPRRIHPVEQALAYIMAPTDGPSRMHGLHGKKLVYDGPHTGDGEDTADHIIAATLPAFLFHWECFSLDMIRALCLESSRMSDGPHHGQELIQYSGPYFKDYFNQPSRAEIGTMVAILEVGAFVASLSVGTIGDILGRRRTIGYGAVIFLVGGALQTFATGMPMMLVGRIIAGLGVGALSTIVPVYQSEISPPHNRGKLACIEFSGNILGYAASVWVDYFCSYIEGDWAWRVPLLMQCAMGALLGVGSLLICESPRYVLPRPSCVRTI